MPMVEDLLRDPRLLSVESPPRLPSTERPRFYVSHLFAYNFIFNTHMAHVAINYILAPEHPFPAALHDFLSSYLYLIQPPSGSSHARIHPSRIIFPETLQVETLPYQQPSGSATQSSLPLVELPFCPLGLTPKTAYRISCSTDHMIIFRARVLVAKGCTTGMPLNIARTHLHHRSWRVRSHPVRFLRCLSTWAMPSA